MSPASLQAPKPKADDRAGDGKLVAPRVAPPLTSWPSFDSPSPGGGGGFSFSRYLAAVQRYKWLMALVVLIAIGVGFFLARRIRPDYSIHATLWIAPETRRDNTGGPIRGDEVVHPAAWPELLTSFAILDRVARRLMLYLAPTDPRDAGLFAGAQADDRVRPGMYSLRVDTSGRRYILSAVKGPRLEAGLTADSIGRSIGLRWQASPEALGYGRTIDFSVVSPRAAALALRSRLTASLPVGSNLLRVTLVGTDPKELATTTDAIVNEFLAEAASLKKRNLVEVSQTLKQQLDIADRDLHDAESQLERFRVSTITLPSETRAASDAAATDRAGATPVVANPLTQGFFADQASYETARRERIEVERTYAGIRDGSIDPSALNALTAVRTRAPELQNTLKDLTDRQLQLAAAQRRYTDANPIVVDLLQQITALRERTIPRRLEQLLTQLRLAENDLAGQVATTARALRDVPVRSTEETRLRRNVATRENLFNRIKARYEEAQLAEVSAVPDVSVLDTPVPPESPNSNRRPYVLILATLIGVGAAAVLAFVLDRFDPRFRYPEQASEELGLEILGAIPSARPDDINNPQDGMQLVEAFRSVRLNVAQAADSSGRVIVTVTSPNAGDGKSLIAANMAQSFAQAGYRTLLVDGDIRRGELDKRFSVDRSPGLLDYLNGTSALEDMIHETSTDNLSLITRGTPHVRGPELLVSPVMPDLMMELQRRYEAVVVDSPPLGAGIDPFVLGSATGNVLLVLRAGESNRKLAQAKLKLLTRLPVKLLGVVLNNVRMGGDFQYFAYTYSDLKEESKLPVLESQLTDFARRSGLMDR